MTEPRRWLKFAQEDLVAAETMLEKGIYNLACFHSQQGIEKGLKGFLRSRKEAIPRTHALVELVARCVTFDKDFSGLEETCRKLDPYYIPTRYPDALPGAGPEGLPDREEAEEAVMLLRNGLQWIKRKIGLG